MKTLLTGGSSLLGKYLIKSKPENVELESTWFTNYISDYTTYQLDLTNKSQISYVFRKYKPELIIHCAAIGSVDFAQNNYRETWEVNVEGTKNILKSAKEHESKVIYISTNAVYKGDNPPYKEDDRLEPVNAYGSIKRFAEREVQDYFYDWLIVRPFMLYGTPNKGGRTNWAKIVVDKLSNNEELNVVEDVFFQPTYAYDCAENIWELKNKSGIYNLACPDRVSLYEFCLTTAAIFQLNTNLINPLESKDLDIKTPRPTDSTFDLSKLKNEEIELPSLEDALERMYISEIV